MKKLFLILVFIMTTLTSFSQDNPLFLRAETFKAGTVDSNGGTVWDETTFKNCDLLIKLDKTVVTIYSEELQVYRVISVKEETKDGVMWYCADNKGNKCYVYICSVKDSPKLLLGVEYSDYVWYYMCKEDK